MGIITNQIGHVTTVRNVTPLGLGERCYSLQRYADFVFFFGGGGGGGLLRLKFCVHKFCVQLKSSKRYCYEIDYK